MRLPTNAPEPGYKYVPRLAPIPSDRIANTQTIRFRKLFFPNEVDAFFLLGFIPNSFTSFFSFR